MGPEPTIRDADEGDIQAICGFGEAYIRPHYTPLIGADAADRQVRRWWNETEIGDAVALGAVVIAELDGRIVGVGQRGRDGINHAIYKLYVHPEHRGRGLGPRLISSLVRQLPEGVDEMYIEHVAANERAGKFYEREGYVVDRIEPSPTGDPARATVWRIRRLDGTRACLET